MAETFPVPPCCTQLPVMARTKMMLQTLVICLLLIHVKFSDGGEIDELDIAAFNVQVFGRTKISKQMVVDTLKKVIVRYDIILIQEIRDSSETAIYELLDMVNEVSDHEYSLEISDRLGRSSSKEQYGFLYRNDKVQVVESYVYDDGEETNGDDTFEREPFVVRFSSPTTLVSDFAMVAIHTKPSDAVGEIDRLTDVYDDIVIRLGIQDVILLGDFNGGCTYVDQSDWSNVRLRTDDRFTWLIGDRIDTTVADTFCAYDRIVLAGPSMADGVWSGSARVFYFDAEYDLTADEAAEVSDHYPVEMKLLPKLEKTVKSNIRLQASFTVYDDRGIATADDIMEFSKAADRVGFTSEIFRNSKRQVVMVMASKGVDDRGDIASVLREVQEQFPKLISQGQIDVAEENLENGFDDVVAVPVLPLTINRWYVEITCAINDKPQCNLTVNF
ncbi:deoxyribonuclease-1-like isoform X3 [Ptychodera flava]|uniref:deoxyribonuclease-1-like isoform X3 n=1 Tax=Ptychodera flava TaxID=63121 RepID=UPI00396A8633